MTRSDDPARSAADLRPADPAAVPETRCAGEDGTGEDGTTVHGCAVALDGEGVLIIGASGAGKSTLARALVARWTERGRFARFVADDRVALEVVGGRLIARAPSRIAGLVEIHGVGILPVRHLPAVRLSLVVSLDAEAPRFPEEGAGTTVLRGIQIAALCLSQRSTTASSLAVAAVLGADGLTTPPGRTQRPPSLSRA